MFEAKGPIGIVSARRKFFRAQCADDGDIEEHIRLMRSYQQELATLQKPVEEEDFSYAVLTSLPESWNTFISAVPDDIIKSPDKLIARILTELVRLREQTPATTALPVTDKSKVKCYECGKLGHFASDHRKNAPNKNQVDSGHANGQGKSKQQDRKQKGKFKSRAHMAQDDESDGEDDFLFLARDPNLVQSLSPDDWLLDSGCSRTIVRKNTDFSTCSGTPPHKIAGIGETAAIGRGTVPLSFALGHRTRACVMRDVLHCPTAPFNLISVARLTDASYSAVFKGETVELRSRKGALLAVGDKISRMYRLRVAPQGATSDRVLIARTWNEWHNALGHLNMKSLKHLKAHGMVNGMEVRNEKSDMEQCTACIQGKAHVKPFPRAAEREYDEIGDMTYTDLWGKTATKGIRGEQYYISFTDGHTSHSKVGFLKTKEGDTVLDKIKAYVAFIETQTGRKVKCFRFDGGKEYVNETV